jgi:hypothetical protein
MSTFYREFIITNGYFDEMTPFAAAVLIRPDPCNAMKLVDNAITVRIILA